MRNQFLLLVLIICSVVCANAHNTKRMNLVNVGMDGLSEGVITCEACKIFAGELHRLIHSNASMHDVIAVATKMCIWFKIEDETVCNGLIPQFQQMAYAVLTSPTVTPKEVCEFIAYCDDGEYLINFNISFPKPKPPHVNPSPPGPNSPTFTILHISDLHFDALYQPGTNTNCGEPLCCRTPNGPGNAGKWGDYSCDINPLALNSMFNYSASLQPDFIFWTGDNPPHDLWLQTEEGQLNSTLVITEMLLKAFPNTTVYPSIGNHESLPVNSFPVYPGNTWLYSALAKQWTQWLDADALQTLNYGGFYTMVMKPGFRVMSLNMNFCNNINAWLILSTTDPNGMLQWIITTLQAAEDANEKVYLVGHIPPGIVDCVEGWSRWYYQILERYEDTIIAQFYGHTHNDQFEVFYTQNDTTTPHRPFGIAYIVPSVTTLTNENPSFRIYTADTTSGYIVESSTYHLDIVQANQNDEANWVLEYNATSSYNMKSLFPTDWDTVANNMATDQNMFNDYYKFYTSGGPNSACDSTCQQEMICGMKSGTNLIYKQCLKDFGLKFDYTKHKTKSC